MKYAYGVLNYNELTNEEFNLALQQVEDEINEGKGITSEEAEREMKKI